MKSEGKTRIERDSMGEMEVPQDALYGASTQRAVLNFPISSLRLPRRFLAALGTIKLGAARANMSLGLLDKDRGDAIVEASQELIDGILDRHFPVDVFQTGSGTSTNMNANEVIANRALEILGLCRGDRNGIHPNDHVNACQSSNDVFPSAIHIAAYESIKHLLVPAFRRLTESLALKSREFSKIIKTGRTHLQDATPITLGQEFSGYASQMRHSLERISRSSERLLELALGGTAVGTGLNAHPEFARRAISEISCVTNSAYREGENHFELQASQDAALEVSGQLRTAAIAMMKIANDIRWLSSGPRCAIGEIYLPEIQPGSSIMPAKVNPVICESVLMVCAQVIGNDTTVMICGQHGNFELNTMMPVLAYNLLESIELLGRAANNFTEKCTSGITANVERCLGLAEMSLATVTALAPKIGYDKAAELAKRAMREDKAVRQVALDMKLAPKEDVERLLDLDAMTRPGV